MYLSSIIIKEENQKKYAHTHTQYDSFIVQISRYLCPICALYIYIYYIYII